MIDHETPTPQEAVEEFQKEYEDIMSTTAALLNKWANPSAPLLEQYPIPIIEIDGKK